MGAVVAVRPALVEEDGGGVGVDTVLAAHTVVHRAVHRPKVNRAANQRARLANN